jgi:hypothetical protein
MLMTGPKKIKDERLKVIVYYKRIAAADSNHEHNVCKYVMRLNNYYVGSRP